MTLTGDPSKADATLVFELEGAGISEGYSIDANPANVRYATTGGNVKGAIWIAGAADNKVTFEGYAKPANYHSVGDPNKPPKPGTDYSDVTDDISTGVTSALPSAYFHHRLAELFYNECSPAAGVYLNFYDNIPQMRNPMKKREATADFYARMFADYEEIKPMLFAAALGVPNTHYIYDASSDALRMVTDNAPEDRDLIWKARHGPGKPGPWEIQEIILEPGETLEEKFKE